ncbi:MAG TPA: hypothetical protein VHV08_04970, partial [Pirellulales bacterium]|nr:hypothetical protein [Pirellulales bacterium]
MEPDSNRPRTARDDVLEAIAADRQHFDPEIEKQRAIDSALRLVHPFDERQPPRELVPSETPQQADETQDTSHGMPERAAAANVDLAGAADDEIEQAFAHDEELKDRAPQQLIADRAIETLPHAFDEIVYDAPAAADPAPLERNESAEPSEQGRQTTETAPSSASPRCTHSVVALSSFSDQVRSVLHSTAARYGHRVVEPEDELEQKICEVAANAIADDLPAHISERPRGTLDPAAVQMADAAPSRRQMLAANPESDTHPPIVEPATSPDSAAQPDSTSKQPQTNQPSWPMMVVQSRQSEQLFFAALDKYAQQFRAMAREEARSEDNALC